MIQHFFIYLFIMAGVTYLIRAIPFIAVRKKIDNQFIRSFLYYIPYTVLSAMTVPAIFYATGSVISAVIGFAVGIILALANRGLITVAIASSAVVLVTDLILMNI